MSYLLTHNSGVQRTWEQSDLIKVLEVHADWY